MQDNRYIFHKSFFEYLAIADLERIHSQTIAWLFSPDCLALGTVDKNQTLKDLFSISTGKVVSIQTEKNGIDILIETTTDIIIIENKIKSSQHSNQLNKYKNYCDKAFPGLTKHYYYLTLIGERADSKSWEHISYIQLYDRLKLISLIPGNSHTVIVIEYFMYLERLTAILHDFNNTPEKFDTVFLDGDKTKEEKLHIEYKNANERFIGENQLETILQRSFLKRLSEKVSISKGIVSETRGDALVDFPVQSGILYKRKKYTTFLQLQENTLKFAFSLDLSKHNKSESKKELIKGVIPKMRKLSQNNKFGYIRLNEPKSNAYISISKRISGHYWHRTIDELVHLITDEIRNAKILTKELIILLKAL